MAGGRASVVSSFTIVKGALVDETYAVFRHWDFGQSREDNLRRAAEANVIGATSTSWLRFVCKVLHRRFDPAGPDRPLVLLAQGGCEYATWKPLLLWHLTRDEFLVRDFLVNWLFPRFQAGALRLRAEDLHPYLASLPARRLVPKAWTESTRSRVASGLLGMAADFGLLTGTTARAFPPYRLPDRSFLYLLHAMTEAQPGAGEVVRSPDWRMYLMDPGDVERELYRLHQFRRLRYEVAGSLVQLTLPCASAAAYAAEMLS